MPPRTDVTENVVAPMDVDTSNNDASGGKSSLVNETDLSEEDQKLKNELEMCVNEVEKLVNKLIDIPIGPLSSAKKTGSTRSSARLRKDSTDQLDETLTAIDKNVGRLSELIRASTTSMTSVPKPLKFLLSHYARMKQIYYTLEVSVKKEKSETTSLKSRSMNWCDIVSVVAMTATASIPSEKKFEKGEEGESKDHEKDTEDKNTKGVVETASSKDLGEKNVGAGGEKSKGKTETSVEDSPETSGAHVVNLECLHFKMLANYKTIQDVERWGHEYIRHLTSQIVTCWTSYVVTFESGGENGSSSPSSSPGKSIPKNGTAASISSVEASETVIPIQHMYTEAFKKELLQLVECMIPCQMKHHAEADACDLLMEIDHLNTYIHKHINENSYQRVALYLASCVPYLPNPDNVNLLKTVLKIYETYREYPLAMRLALQINDPDIIRQVFHSAANTGENGSPEVSLMQKQLAFMLARQQHFIENLDESLYDEIIEIMSNSLLNQNFLNLARELDIMDAKTPEDVYKSHLDQVGPFGGISSVDTAAQTLASTFVNAFVNAGFGRDKLVLSTTSASSGEEGSESTSSTDINKWLYKNKKDTSMMSATASIGMILLWDVDGGLTRIDRYLYAPEVEIRAGALLACGIVNSGVRNECDPALALLSDYVSWEKPEAAGGSPSGGSHLTRIGAILGLGMAYAGSNREDVIAEIVKVFGEEPASGFASEKTHMEIIGIAALALGLIGVGSANNDIVTTILATLIEKCVSIPSDDEESESTSDSHSKKEDSSKSKNSVAADKSASAAKFKPANSPYAKYLPLAIGLCYLGRQDGVEATIATLEVLDEPFKSMAITLVEICAYAGSGNVLKIQEMLHIASFHYNNNASSSSSNENANDKKSSSRDDSATEGSSQSGHEEEEGEVLDKSSQQSVAVLGLGLIAMGEEIGCEMLFRSFGHLLRYSECSVRKAVPLALALTSISNPQIHVIDTLSKFSHDSDTEVASNAIMGLGLIGAGTNNARLASLLRQLAQYHAKEATLLYCIRLAQGLVHMGKGTLTLNPFHSDGQLMSPVAVAGLLTVALSFVSDAKSTIIGPSSSNCPTYLMFTLATAMQPRMLLTLDSEELRPLSVNVRVGQAVDVVGQAGKPKTITGFQTHTTPVLVAGGERAELATEDFKPLTPIMEGFVILEKVTDEASEGSAKKSTDDKKMSD